MFPVPRLVCGARKSRSSALLDLYWAHSLKRLNLCLPLSVSLQFIPAFNTFCFALEHLPVKSLELCSTSFPLAGSAGLVQSRILLFTACIQFLCLSLWFSTCACLVWWLRTEFHFRRKGEMGLQVSDISLTRLWVVFHALDRPRQRTQPQPGQSRHKSYRVCTLWRNELQTDKLFKTGMV